MLGQRRDERAHLGVFGLEGGLDAMLAEGFGRRRTDRTHQEPPIAKCGKNFRRSAILIGDLEQVGHLLRRREQGGVDPPLGDFQNCQAERLDILRQGPLVDGGRSRRSRPDPPGPGSNPGAGWPYSWTATRRPETGSFASRVARMSRQVFGSGTWMSTRTFHSRITAIGLGPRTTTFTLPSAEKNVSSGISRSISAAR